MRFIRTLLGFVIAAILATLCVTNMHVVSFTWNIFSESIQIPLYIILLSSAALGFLLGAISMWIDAGPLRKTNKKQRKKIKEITNDITNLTAPKNTAPNDDFFPALPERSKHFR